MIRGRPTAPRARRAVRRPGFTLVEILVALAVSSVVVLGSRQVLTSLADQAERITELAATADRSANGERVLRGLVGRVQPGLSGEQRFAGDSEMARFTSWCDVIDGWQERCEVVLSVSSAEPDGGGVIARLSTGEVLPVVTRVSSIRLLYLADAGSRLWLESWGAGIIPPIAIGLACDTDTLIVRIGERG